MSKINWDDVAELESIANQCIYVGKEVGQARAALKAIYGYDIEYDDEKDEPCSKEDKKTTT
ncbi:MAG: hypothetical protein HY062_00210 [Bacteroidetes bacterium]|nr:hypothetical protein [Bacteroidota bacterium]